MVKDSNIKDILYDDQFRLKLGLPYFLASKEALIVIALVLLFFDEWIKIIGYSVIGLMLVYKFLFNKVKGDNYYVEVYALLSKLFRKIRKNAK